MAALHDYEGHQDILFRVLYGPIWIRGKYVVSRGLQLMSIYDLLQQDEFWIDSTQRSLRVREMAPEHVRNLIRYLQLKAKKLKPWWMFWRRPKDWLERRPLMMKLIEIGGS